MKAIDRGVEQLAEPPSLMVYAGVVARIGLTSFGGGVSGWMMRIVVHEKHWMTEAEFLTGLALCQVFPGINVLNLSIWLGYKLHGGKGAIAGAMAMLVPPGFVLLALAAVFTNLSQYAWVRTALDGVAAAAIGLGAQMGVRATQRSATAPVPILIAVATFATVGLLRWPLVPVVAALVPVSIGWTVWQGRRNAS